ncbi:MAG: aminoglycoside phosphotransferase family protein [Caldilineaceae bacterium]|nr:aminoglycoside phosphotransferase family protein [Caldilineaceae bacterium]
MEKLYRIAQEFTHPYAVQQVQAYGAGNVNDTYVVTRLPPVGADTDTVREAALVQPTRFVLQRVNTHVFRQPDLILLNMRTFLEHMAQQIGQAEPNPTERWEMPQIIPTATGSDYYLDQAGDFWRAISLIERAKTYPKIRDAAHARESGLALGRFHRLLSGLDPALLHDTLPGFHITPQYLQQYDQSLTSEAAQARQQSAAAAQVAWAQQFVADRRAWATILEDAQARGELQLRAIHGDPKVDNILIDDQSGKAVSIIDLDTVKPGLVHYDIGDCLRSCCNPAGEETTDLDSVIFDTDLCQVILTGYLQEAAHFFTPADYAYLYDAIRLITFELGLRFFTDYLAGDVYFKVKHDTHNLQRALVQFRLAECIEQNEQAIKRIIAEQQH